MFGIPEDLGDIKLRPLNADSVYVQLRLENAKSLTNARLELFMESFQRVGMEGRIPRCHSKELGGYSIVEMQAVHRHEADRLIFLINEYENGRKIPSYIMN